MPTTAPTPSSARARAGALTADQEQKNERLEPKR